MIRDHRGDKIVLLVLLDLQSTEQRLRESGMTYTILSPNMLMDVWVPMIVGGPAVAGQPVTLVGEGRHRHSFASMGDVVQYASRPVNKRSGPRSGSARAIRNRPGREKFRPRAAIYSSACGAA